MKVVERPELRYWDHAQGPVPDWYWEMEREALRVREDNVRRRDRWVFGFMLGFGVWCLVAGAIVAIWS